MELKCPIEMPPAVGYLTRSAGVSHLSLFTKFSKVHSEVYNANLSSEYDFIYSIHIYYILYFKLKRHICHGKLIIIFHINFKCKP